MNRLDYTRPALSLGISDLLKNSASSSASSRLRVEIHSLDLPLIPFSVDAVAAVYSDLSASSHPGSRRIDWTTLGQPFLLGSQTSSKTPRLPPPLRDSALKFTASTFHSSLRLRNRP